MKPLRGNWFEYLHLSTIIKPLRGEMILHQLYTQKSSMVKFFE